MRDLASPLDGFLSPFGAVRGRVFSPLSLFASGEAGAWYDPSDLSTLWKDTAGTDPVTTAGDTVARVDDKSGNGNNLTQATAPARPAYARGPETGRRNLLTYTEEFDNAVWTKLQVTASVNSATAPDGTMTANSLFSTAENNGHYARNSLTVPSGDLTATYYVKYVNWPRVSVRIYDGAVGTRFATYNIQTGVVTASASGVTASITEVGDGWYRITHTTAGVSGSGFSEIHFASTDTYTGSPYAGSATDEVLIWGAQLEVGATATAYQRVVSDFDVTEAGVPSIWRLDHDGVDDVMNVTLPDLGTDATVASVAGGTVTYLEAQTISGSYAVPTSDWAGLVIIDRALTADEKTALEGIWT